MGSNGRRIEEVRRNLGIDKPAEKSWHPSKPGKPSLQRIHTRRPCTTSIWDPATSRSVPKGEYPKTPQTPKSFRQTSQREAAPVSPATDPWRVNRMSLHLAHKQAPQEGRGIRDKCVE